MLKTIIPIYLSNTWENYHDSYVENGDFIYGLII
eukprot:UN18966